MKRTVVIVVMLASSVALGQRPPREAGPRPPGPPPELIEELAGDLKLKDAQKTQIRDLADEARKHQVKLRAEMEVNEIDLRRELEKDEPDEKKVGALVDKLSSLEADARKAQLGAWLKIRKVLTKEQREKLEELHRKRREQMMERERRRHEERPGGFTPP